MNTLKVELLAIDLSTCSRCTGSLSSIEQAIATLKQVLAVTGTMVQFDKIIVESEAQAKQLRFVSSPTIRINDQDIVLDTVESRCGDCSQISGSSQGTACRVWQYQGQEHTEAPVGMIMDAMLREIYSHQSPATTPTNYFQVPENIQEFFHSKAQKTECCGTTQASPTPCGCK